MARAITNRPSVIIAHTVPGKGVDFMEYDYHILDIWPIIYVFFVRQGKGDIYRSEQTFREFGLPARKSHDALEDCRHTAEVLRKIVFETK